MESGLRGNAQNPEEESSMFKLPPSCDASPAPHWELVTTLLRHADLTEERKDFLRDLERKSWPLSWEEMTVLELLVRRFVADQCKQARARLLAGQHLAKG
jgi:hypothetical protein